MKSENMLINFAEDKKMKDNIQKILNAEYYMDSNEMIF